MLVSGKHGEGGRIDRWTAIRRPTQSRYPVFPHHSNIPISHHSSDVKTRKGISNEDD